MEVKKDILWRVYLTYLGLIIFGLMILGKAFYTQQFEGRYWKSMGDSLHTKIMDLDAERGTIFSEDGSMLSTSIPQFDIYVDFGAEGLREKNGERFFKNVDSLAFHLSQLFKDKSKADYLRELKNGYTSKIRYYALQKKVSFEQYKLFRDFPLVRLGRNKSGVIVEVKSKRYNPYGELAYRTIGLHRENVRLVGLERSFDSILKGTSGKRLVRYVAGGVLMPVEGFEVEPENGHDIYTTIDINIQDVAERALMKKMQEKEALEGTCVVMEVATGKIKAMANLGRGKDGQYFEIDNYALRTSEPGSTIKLITLMIALDDQKATIKDEIDINNGVWHVAKRRIRDDHNAPAKISLRDAFTHSSNVAMSKLAYMNYQDQPEKYYERLKSLHLTRKTGIELKEEFQPYIKDPSNKKSWNVSALISWGFGYELQISPLQMLMVYNAVANNGKLMKPYLVNEIKSYGTVVKKYEPVVLNKQIASPETIAQLKECLNGVCTEGTAKNVFHNALYKAAGKTGTAKVSDGVFSYNDGVYQAAFAGYFPADQPRYSMIVVIKNKPHVANYYGGQVAAPVFREVADQIFKYIGNTPPPFLANPNKDTMAYSFSGNKEAIRLIANEFTWNQQDSLPGLWRSVKMQRNQIFERPFLSSTNVIPDVRGFGLKDALYVLETAGYRATVSGKGKVMQQSVVAGTVPQKRELIHLNLSE